MEHRPAMRYPQAGRWLGLLVAAMFGFAFALVPLYEVFCRVTGLNGKLESRAMPVGHPAAGGREVSVQFVANVQGHLPWRFTPLQRRITVRPGEEAMAMFEVQNLSDRPSSGRAVANLMPGAAATHLTKVQCFCFEGQSLAPGETRVLHVSFVVDPALPARYRSLTLVYTFLQPRTETLPVAEGDAG